MGERGAWSCSCLMGPGMSLWEVITTHFFVGLCSICSYTLLWRLGNSMGILVRKSVPVWWEPCCSKL